MASHDTRAAQLFRVRPNRRYLSPRRLRQNILQHIPMDVREPELAALVAVRQPVGIEAVHRVERRPRGKKGTRKRQVPVHAARSVQTQRSVQRCDEMSVRQPRTDADAERGARVVERSSTSEKDVPPAPGMRTSFRVAATIAASNSVSTVALATRAATVESKANTAASASAGARRETRTTRLPRRSTPQRTVALFGFNEGFRPGPRAASATEIRRQ